MPLFEMEKSSIPSKLLSDRYVVPPFSILNTITQAWQKRKDRWEDLGIDSAKGRDVKRNNALPVNTFSARGAEAKEAERTSTFDPVVCEIIYKWFTRNKPHKSVILDPWAGGSVRGIVANALGLNYIGIDLSETQIITNYTQLDEFVHKYGEIGTTEWIAGDSVGVLDLVGEQKFDLIFTCPPYYNLEKYSNDPRDLSNLKTYDEFVDKYSLTLHRCSYVLKEDRFAVIVVSEVRDPKTGEYYGLVPDTIKIMQDAGFRYYNELILENNIGSLPIRAPKYFDRSRKIGRQHQNILVFYKGDPQNIESVYGKYEPENG